MRHATVFPANDTSGFVMYAGGTVNCFDSLSKLRAFVEANNINARFASYNADQAATLSIAAMQAATAQAGAKATQAQ